MKKLSKNRLLDIVINLLVLLLLAKLIAVVAMWVLPKSSVEYDNATFKQLPYVRMDFSNLISGEKETHVRTRAKTSDAISINNMILLGLYGNEDSGFAIVAMKSAPKKTEIIGIGEVYKGYRLSKIFLNYVIFTKNSKEYILRLQESSAIKTAPKSTQSSAEVDTFKSIARSDINYYTKNPGQIWRDISIQELKVGGKIEGFKVIKIQKNSKFAQLGLQRGDIIIEANGRALHSYKDVLEVYENIDKLDALALKVKRGNQEKEIIYEIH